MKARAEATGRRMLSGCDDPDAYSIVEFCRRHNLSVSAFYKLRKEMPESFNIGTRVLISREAAAAWRAKRTAAAAAEKTD